MEEDSTANIVIGITIHSAGINFIMSVEGAGINPNIISEHTQQLITQVGVAIADDIVTSKKNGSTH